MPSILVTGAHGQIGSELVAALRDRAASSPVVAFDVVSSSSDGREAGPFVEGDVRDRGALADVIETHDVATVYHLASLLSATGEEAPDQAWDVNVTGLKNVLDLARKHDLRVFWPSSIAVFGPSTPKTEAPQQTTVDPSTIYGVTKRSGELLCQYYYRRYGLDVRSLRLPGVISYKTNPGGGTTDYAVDMYRRAVQGEDYTCFLTPDTRLPLLYMPDALRAILRLMEADGAALSVRDSYNVSGFSASPQQVAAAIQEHEASFTCAYAPDRRQQIADTWPASVDDTAARRDWSWAPTYDLDAMTEDMLVHLRAQYAASGKTGAP